MRSAENGPQLLYTLSSMHIVDEALLKYPALVALISGVLCRFGPIGASRNITGF